MKNSPKLLLVEDEEPLKEVYLEVLQDAGYQVDVAMEGDTALEKISLGGYDLILLDVMLPNKDGLQIMRSLQQKPPQKPNQKVISMTNLAHENLHQEAEKYHVSDVMIKTDLTPDLFLKKVQTYLAS